MAYLVDNPELQTQPTSTTCVPTCIAMAIGEPVFKVISEIKDLGIDISEGMTDRQISYYLGTKGISIDPYITRESCGLLLGSYLICTPSLNILGGLHCVLAIIREDDDGHYCNIYDPNELKDGKKYYKYWEDLPLCTIIALDDFRDLKEKLDEKS